MPINHGKSLFRQMTRHARKIEDYNFREYAIRKLRNSFLKNASLGGEELKNALEQAKDDMEMLQR